MLTGAHVIVYAHDAEKARAFFRDVFKFPHVDAGGGWLIFGLPPAELEVLNDAAFDAMLRQRDRAAAEHNQMALAAAG